MGRALEGGDARLFFASGGFLKSELLALPLKMAGPDWPGSMPDGRTSPDEGDDMQTSQRQSHPQRRSRMGAEPAKTPTAVDGSGAEAFIY